MYIHIKKEIKDFIRKFETKSFDKETEISQQFPWPYLLWMHAHIVATLQIYFAILIIIEKLIISCVWYCLQKSGHVIDMWRQYEQNHCWRVFFHNPELPFEEHISKTQSLSICWPNVDRSLICWLTVGVGITRLDKFTFWLISEILYLVAIAPMSIIQCWVNVGPMYRSNLT